MQTVNLFWYNGITNVGDVASNYIVKRITPLRVQYKTPFVWLQTEIKKFVLSLLHGSFYRPKFSWYIYPWNKCVYGIGSILDYSKHNTTCWGCGFREYDSVCKPGNYVAVRGYLSLSKLPNPEGVAIGDPALLLPLIIDQKYNELPTIQTFAFANKLSLIAHYNDYDDISNRFGDNYELIDVRTDDIVSFVNKIKQSDCVLSTSLHGIIISHAFGIPALWIYNNYTSSGSFKFHDYFSSVGITLYEGFMNIDEILASQDSWKQLFVQNWDKALPQVRIEPIAQNLLRVAPFPIHSYIKDLCQEEY